MPTLISHLRSFNRKERFILLEATLGADTFVLGDAFRSRLGGEIGVAVPADAFVAMDYHLDWLQMAIYLRETPSPPARIPNKDRMSGTQKLVRGNQEDIDLLVAFEVGPVTHLVLIEAKVETSWTNKQLKSKQTRLASIFGRTSTDAGPITPHFVLMSPAESAGIRFEEWPAWMLRAGKPAWLELPRPRGLTKVTRCDAEMRPSASGDYLLVDPLT